MVLPPLDSATKIYLIFDSHPRPEQRIDGAYIYSTQDLDAMDTRLKRLFPFQDFGGGDQDMMAMMYNSFDATPIVRPKKSGTDNEARPEEEIALRETAACSSPLLLSKGEEKLSQHQQQQYNEQINNDEGHDEERARQEGATPAVELEGAHSESELPSGYLN